MDLRRTSAGTVSAQVVCKGPLQGQILPAGCGERNLLPGPRRGGIDQSVIDVVKYNRAIPAGMLEKEAAVIRLSRAIFRDRKVSPELWATMEQSDRRDLSAPGRDVVPGSSPAACARGTSSDVRYASSGSTHTIPSSQRKRQRKPAPAVILSM